MGEKDWGTPALPISDTDNMGFQNVFPSETSGDGFMRPNNSRTGASQGRGGFKRKVRCQICGFLVDINKVDYSGGSLDGQGAGGVVTESADVGTLNNGDTTDSGHPNESSDGGTAYGPTHSVGEQAIRKGGGGPFCFSKNSSKVKNYTLAPIPRPMVGL